VIQLREYQQEALDALRAKLGGGTRRICMVAPTGAGKTTIAGAMIHGAMAKGRRCIFLAHRKELIEQCSGRLDQFGIPHGIIQQKHRRTDPRKSVQVASVQTLIRKDHWDADLIIVDECHRSTSKTYTKILDRYTNRPAIIGLTATPYRLDGRGLGEIYDDIHPVATCQNLIDLEHLVMPTIYGAREVDLSSVKVTAGDFNKKDLAVAMKEVVFQGELVSNWGNRVMAETGAQTIAECRACTVVFAPSVELSIKIIEQFQAQGIPSAHIDAKTPPKVRDEVLRQLRAREISVVSNVGLLTEGWDLPHLECVVLVRPTRSRSLYKQMIGRLMRPDAQKRFAIVLDHANCTKMHGFVNEPEDYTLDGREKRKRKGESNAPHKTCRKCEALLPLQTKVCPSCGSVQFIVDIKFTDEELVRLDPSKFKKAEQVPQSERQKSFEELCKQCVAREFKPNWARVRYQKIYGEWPAWKSGIRTPRFFRTYEQEFHRTNILDQVASLLPVEPPSR
jgi:superfamily II DNA or RNA helicase